METTSRMDSSSTITKVVFFLNISIGLKEYLRLFRTSRTTNTQITAEEAERNSRLQSYWRRSLEGLGQDDYMNGEQEEDLEDIAL